ncbi:MULTISPECIES: hypothetical protein [Methylomonas]|uniref:Uncharacterized protein n=2 Tax=Methylomonas TaxID=416 RepID=A0A140E7B5_9GAMM|nr:MULTISPECIES: hypothetical protein [Methylomonas]AMK79289.1 hypothetical protein JT25_022845 [Methylomonas denitrificans]OAI03276.1 hypothetical protein A1342_09210 [Methylomonas methanica]TCV86192.1 hypothetical protein EDE11_104136 [Methylomonas methanica]
MKRKSLTAFCLLSVLSSTACQPLVQPDTSTSQTIIESLLPLSQPDQPWRLDSAWQASALGGAVYRASSLEHVVRQVDHDLTVTKPHTESLVQTVGEVSSQSNIEDPELLERAWRKYCHHQLDMTPEERALIPVTQIPHQILSHGCTPYSLKK